MEKCQCATYVLDYHLPKPQRVQLMTYKSQSKTTLFWYLISIAVHASMCVHILILEIKTHTQSRNHILSILQQKVALKVTVEYSISIM